MKKISFVVQNASKKEKIHLKKFQTHMCNFLFGNFVLTLNYKYYKVTSSAKTFSNAFYSSRCSSKEYPPKWLCDLGGVLAQMSVWKGFVVKRFWPLKIVYVWGILIFRWFHFLTSNSFRNSKFQLWHKSNLKNSVRRSRSPLTSKVFWKLSLDSNSL